MELRIKGETVKEPEGPEPIEFTLEKVSNGQIRIVATGATSGMRKDIGAFAVKHNGKCSLCLISQELDDLGFNTNPTTHEIEVL